MREREREGRREKEAGSEWMVEGERGRGGEGEKGKGGGG